MATDKVIKFTETPDLIPSIDLFEKQILNYLFKVVRIKFKGNISRSFLL